jgi:hypothetical protein
MGSEVGSLLFVISMHDGPNYPPRSVLTRSSRTTPLSYTTADSSAEAKGEIVEESLSSLKGLTLTSERDSLVRGRHVSRSSPPFIAAYDIPRGIAFAFQTLLSYFLMLAVMWVPSLLCVDIC